jgi:hypothetical protein
MLVVGHVLPEWLKLSKDGRPKHKQQKLLQMGDEEKDEEWRGRMKMTSKVKIHLYIRLIGKVIPGWLKPRKDRTPEHKQQKLLQRVMKKRKQRWMIVTFINMVWKLVFMLNISQMVHVQSASRDLAESFTKTTNYEQRVGIVKLAMT